MSWASVAMGPSVYANGLAEVREALEQAGLGTPGVPLAAREERRRGRHPGAHAGPEVGGDAALDGLGAAVGIEARDVEPQPLRALPELRVLEAAGVGEQRVVHGPDRALGRRGLGGRCRGPGARVARA